jgi:hypothetical protein
MELNKILIKIGKELFKANQLKELELRFKHKDKSVNNKLDEIMRIE